MPQENPRFVMTRLILQRKPQVYAVNLNSAVLANEPFFVEVWRLHNTAQIGTFKRNAAIEPKAESILVLPRVWRFWTLPPKRKNSTTQEGKEAPHQRMMGQQHHPKQHHPEGERGEKQHHTKMGGRTSHFTLPLSSSFFGLSPFLIGVALCFSISFLVANTLKGGDSKTSKRETNIC